MKQETYRLFESEDIETISDSIIRALATSKELAFWFDRVVPFSRAVLSVLIPLRNRDILFDPQGNYSPTLTPELFIEWHDFVSLKMLAFTLQMSNTKGQLLRTHLEEPQCQNYTSIDLKILADYLNKYNVNLEYENLDFPLSAYNLHKGLSGVIQSLL